MKYYLAPLEGITTYIYRNAYHKYFHKMDKYFTPFIVSHKEKRFNTRELKELSPEHNQGLCVVPQIMSNDAEDFLKTASDMIQLGYTELNLNLGCPSKTVVSKGKGSGFLAFPDKLDSFLAQIFEKLDCELSIKTRIGKSNPEEFHQLMEIYNKYPIKELIIHPRIQTDYYQNKPNWDMYAYATKHSNIPLCYNGDIHTKFDYDAFRKYFPETEYIMCGRGIIANPGLVGLIEANEGLDKNTLSHFHNELLESYIEISSGDRNVLFKMKELWFYMGHLFVDANKMMKKIKKVEKVVEYESIIETLFQNFELRKECTSL